MGHWKEAFKLTWAGDGVRDKIGIFGNMLAHVSPSPTIKTKYGKFMLRKGSYDWKVLHPDYEKAVKERMEGMKMESGVFVDVGANVGLYTIFIGNTKGCRVLAIEPDRDIFWALLKNLSLNDLRRKTMTENVGCHSQREKEGNYKINAWAEQRTSKMERLDYILEQWRITPDEVKVMKVDVEGAESQVFLGAKELLKHGGVKIFFESLTPCSLDKDKRILKRFGYSSIEKIDERNYLATKNMRGKK